MVSQSKIIDNVYSVAKEKGKLIKDIENAVGMSVGYLSRMKDYANGPRLSVDVLQRICGELNIGVEELMNYDEGMTGGERKLVNFVTKLIEDTNDDILKWNFYPKETYDRVRLSNRLSPLFSTDAKQIGKGNKIISHYVSEFNQQNEFKAVVVNKGVYATVIHEAGQDVRVILSSVEYRKGIGNTSICHPGYELYLAIQLRYSPLINAIADHKEKMFAILKKLFAAAQESQSRLCIDDVSNSIIDSYLGKDKKVTGTGTM